MGFIKKLLKKDSDKVNCSQKRAYKQVGYDDDITWNTNNGYADFGDCKIYNKDVARRTAERMKSIRPNAKHFKFEEIVAEGLTTFAIMAEESDKDANKSK